MAAVSPTPVATTYLFDTNAFVDLGERYYPEDVFGCLWTSMLTAIGGGTAVTCKKVIGELVNMPVVPRWRRTVQAACKARAVDESDSDVQRAFARLAGLAIPRSVGEVDRWVLAAAEARALPVVTRDGPITALCRNGLLSVRSLTPTDFFREVGWSFP